MDFNEYQALAMRTANRDPNLTDIEITANLALGLAGEAGETVDYLKKVLFHGHPVSRDHIIKELGDVQWYLATLAARYGIDLEEVAMRNIAKLKDRYPDGFSHTDSRERR